MSIKLKITGIFLCLIPALSALVAQSTSEILVHDLNTKTLESIATINYDPDIRRDHTEHSCGAKKIAKLDQDIPTSDLIDNTNFTNLIPLSSLQSDLMFPYTTGVKIVLPGNNDKHQASGVMVGDRYVLTAGHSVLTKYTNDLLFDEIDVIASYDDALNGDEMLRSDVSKIYFVKNWSIGDGEDLVLLELEKPLGEVSGWMSIGFDEEQSLTGDLYHKMSYPAYNTPYNKTPYTGDDLYISYGVADYVSPEFIGVQNHIVGLGGESGSPIFSTNNEDEFITYGVLTYLGNYNHTRIRPSIYHAFASILSGEQTTKPLRNELLETFEVSKINNGRVFLNWEMMDKDHFLEYDITRSYDGSHFEYLETIDAADISKNKNYGFVDENPMSGEIFYRLLGIDQEGNEQYLDMKSITIGRRKMYDIRVYPNPTTDYITIEAGKKIEDEVKLMVYNSLGKPVANEKLTSIQKIDTRDFQKGMYYLLVSDKESKESFSFIVQ